MCYKPKQFCFCTTLRQGCFLVAILNVIFAVIGLFISLIVFSNPQLELSFSDIAIGFYAGATMLYVSSISAIVSSAFLLVGLRQEKQKFLRIFMRNTCATSGVYLIFMFLLFAFILVRVHDWARGVLVWAIVYAINFLIFGAVSVYSVSIVGAYCEEITDIWLDTY